MTADDESNDDKPKPFDYQRDVEEAASDQITPLAKKYARESVTWMYLWAIMIGAMLVITLFQLVLDLWRVNGDFMVGIMVLAPVIIFGLPLALLVKAASAFSSFSLQGNLPDLARGLRCQFWLSVSPFSIMLLFLLLGLIIGFVGSMTGVYYSV